MKVTKVKRNARGCGVLPIKALIFLLKRAFAISKISFIMLLLNIINLRFYCLI